MYIKIIYAIETHFQLRKNRLRSSKKQKKKMHSGDLIITYLFVREQNQMKIALRIKIRKPADFGNLPTFLHTFLKLD